MLFEKFSLGNCEIKNRIVRSATFERLATQDGINTDELKNKMRELADGEVGLIISGHAYVSPEGRACEWQLAVDRNECIDGLKSMSDTVHQAGSKIFLQLAHAGGLAKVRKTAMGPSPFTSAPNVTLCREMTTEDINKTIDAFVAAALRAKRAGFDGIQIHSAHGYLFSQFLSPYYNKRTDEYGGSLENRSRFLLETFCAVKKATGRRFPIIVKINSEDFLEDGLTSQECLEVCNMLEKAGIDGIEFSGGIVNALEFNPFRLGDILSQQAAYYQESAAKFKQQAQIPLILVGGIRYYEQAETLINKGITDFIALSRPLICEPKLIKRWMTGDKHRAKCISCNKCSQPVLTSKGLCCAVNEKIITKKQL